MKLTASKLVRVICAVHVVVTLLVLANALAVGTAELVFITADCEREKAAKPNQFENLHKFYFGRHCAK